MGFRAGTYRLNFFYDFWKLSLNIEKHISFMGIYIFFQLVPGNKSYTQISSNQGNGDNNFFFEIWISFSWMYPSCRLYFCLCVKLWFIPFGFVMRKLWTILFFGQLEHLLEKITFRIHFWMQFLQFFKKNFLHVLVFFLEQSHHWD